MPTRVLPPLLLERLKEGFFSHGESDTVSPEESTIWDPGGVYQFMDAATELFVASSDPADTVAGIGARSAIVAGLDDPDWHYVEREVELQGTTPVSVGTFVRLFRVTAGESGSLGENAGDLDVGSGTFTAGVPQNLVAQAMSGEGQSRMSPFTIPGNRSGFIVSFWATADAIHVVTVKLRVRPPGQCWRTFDSLQVTDGMPRLERSYPEQLPPRTDIEIRASSQTTAHVTTHCEIVLAPAA
jgi:hypothetical protein